MSDEKKTEGIWHTSGDVSDLIEDFRGMVLDVTTPGCQIGPITIGPFTVPAFTLPPITQGNSSELPRLRNGRYAARYCVDGPTMGNDLP